jgi:hypothetical protein
MNRKITLPADKIALPADVERLQYNGSLLKNQHGNDAAPIGP